MVLQTNSKFYENNYKCMISIIEEINTKNTNYAFKKEIPVSIKRGMKYAIKRQTGIKPIGYRKIKY